MSSSESDVEEDESYQKKMSHSPGTSVVSMKSDQSMGLPMKFSEEQKKSLFKKKRSGSPEISITSVKRKSSDSPYEQADAPRKKYKKTRSDSPGPSIVSMKSEQSMGLPMKFSEEQKRYKKRSDSPGPSVVSLKSDQSMGLPMKFSEEQKKDKRGISDPLPGQLETEFLPTRAEYPAGNIRVMEDKAHLSRTRGPDTSWKQSFKSKLQKKFEMISEGILKYGNSRLLNEVYTELCITSEFRCSHVYEEHEVSFSESCRSLITEESINCNDIFKALPGDERPIRTLLTEGIAGIGKTVSVQKFVLDWTEGKANQDLDFIFPFNFRELHFQKKKCFSLLELLHFYFPETKNQIMDFHHYRIMFIFDGLDESRFTLDFLNSKVLTDPTASASLDVLLTNLINGNLLPSAFLWITSRPAASSEIPPICIHRVTEVRGFSDLQKDEYFRKRISDQDLANKIITHLKSSRSLYIMCHMPVFCWIAATVLEGMFSEAETGEVPKTLTQMFTHFLILQIKRGRLKYKKQEMDPGQVTDIVVKLGKLAFQQLEKGNLIFYEEDLLKCGIDVREATVYSGVCTQIFIEEVSSHLGKVYSFVHLSVQEHLAAVFVFLSCVNGNLSKQEVPEILDLSSTATLLDLLKAAVDKALKSKTGHLDLFLRFLMGLSLESNSVLLQAPLTETVRRYLRNHAAATNKEITTYIKEKIRKNPSEKKSINLFRCLNELDDQSLVQEVQHFLSNRVNHCLQGVKLSAVQWSALVFLLLNSNEVLEEFDLQKYAPSDDCLMKLHQVVAMSRKALLCRCNLTRKSLTSLAKALSSACSCLRELDLSDNNLQDLGFRLLSPGLESPHCKLEILRLHNCQLTQKSCVVIAVVLTSKSTHLIELSLGHNNLQDSGVKSLSGALQSPCCKLKSLSLDECGFTEEGCISLAEALKSNSHLRELDLCANDLGEQGVKMLTDIKEDENYTLEKLKL